MHSLVYRTRLMLGAPGLLALLTLAACAPPEDARQTDGESGATQKITNPSDTSKELPVRQIPNVPPAGEPYYAPDSLHIIAQVQDPDAQKPEGSRVGGSLTYVFTDTGENIRRINDRGQDACSFFFPDMERIVWTSTRDNMDMPLGDWSSQDDYPQGAELYISDLKGNNIQRLTNNDVYEAEVSISPDGQWIVFGRQIDGKLELWRMRADGSEEQQITDTDEWQEGAPFYLPDNETLLFRAWKREDYGNIYPTPMTVFTIKHDGTELKQHTFDNDMNWAPFPAPNGRHYVFVRALQPDNNWEVFLGDLEGGEPVRLTYHDGFDGLPSLSPDGTKMVFARFVSEEKTIRLFVMDVSSLGLSATASNNAQ